MDLTTLSTWPVEAFSALHLPVPDFQDANMYIDHIMRVTESVKYKNTNRADWVWVVHGSNLGGGINGWIPGRLNCIFKLRHPYTYKVWKLASVTMLQELKGNIKPQGPEEMSKVTCRTHNTDMVVNITAIPGMVHMIPIQHGKTWYINNRIDLTTWNETF